MAENLSVILWILVVHAVIYCVPDGISYRELQAVNFYDRTYSKYVDKATQPDESKKTVGIKYIIKGRFRLFFHHLFFSGMLVSLLNSTLFVGWVPFWYYQQPTEWYDVIMALTTLYLGLVRLLPWIFIMTDDNYQTRTWIAIENIKDKKAMPPEVKDDGKVLSAKRTMVFFTLLIVLTILSAVILLCINKGGISDWTIYVSVAFYFVSASMAIVVFAIFVDILYTEKKNSRQKVTPEEKA